MFNLNSLIKQKYIFFVFVLFIFLIVLGYSATYNSIDPDFGWHLRTGQLMLERGVPKIDWYSYTMPSFPWIDHEWLTDVFIYKIYSFFGLTFLLLVFLSVFASAFIILIKRKLFFYFLLPIVLGFLASLGFLGIRPQLLTVFFVAALLAILNKFLQNPNTRLIYLCPILFLIWVNLHGGFLVGLLFIFLFLVLEIFKKTKLFNRAISLRFFSGQNFKIEEPKERPWYRDVKAKILSIILIASAAATFINPYGLRIYKEIFSSVGDSFLKAHINEWMPLFSTSSLLQSTFIILYLGIFLGLIIIFRKKIEFNNLVLSLIFLVFAILSQRNLLIFIILTVPIFSELLFHFRSEIITNEANRRMVKFIFGGFKKWIILSTILGLFAFGFCMHFISNAREKDHVLYSVAAVNFLKTLPLSENLLNEYGLGGYLIWKLPERKVFIDGRMPSWRENGQFVFGDYIKIMGAESGAEALLKKYNIKVAVLDKTVKDEAIKYFDYQAKPKTLFVKFLEKHSWVLKTIGVSPSKKNIYNLLIDSGWHNIYQDSAVIILEK